MESSMNIHVDYIVSNHHDDEISYNLQMGWKTVKFESCSCKHDSNDNEERVHNPIVDHKIFDGCPFNLLPIWSLPIGF